MNHKTAFICAGRCTVALAMIHFTGCRREPPPSVQPSAIQLQECAKLMGLKFPNGARGLMLHYMSGLDDTIFLKAVIRVEDLNTFLNDSPFEKSQLSSVERSVHPRAQLPWWQVNQAKSFLSGVTELPDAERLYLLIDLDSPDLCIVYLNWWET